MPQSSLTSMASQASLDSTGLAQSLKAAHQLNSRASLARLASADASGTARPPGADAGEGRA